MAVDGARTFRRWGVPETGRAGLTGGVGNTYMPGTRRSGYRTHRVMGEAGNEGFMKNRHVLQNHIDRTR